MKVWSRAEPGSSEGAIAPGCSAATRSGSCPGAGTVVCATAARVEARAGDIGRRTNQLLARGCDAIVHMRVEEESLPDLPSRR